MTPSELERYLHDQIPLSRAMGLRVIEAGAERVVVEAPLEPNLNHRATAFGGSVSASAIVAGWTSVHLRLRHEGLSFRTVIHESRVRFDAPIRGPFRAIASRVDDEAWVRFTQALKRHGMARIRLDVPVEADGARAAILHGSYVALHRSAGREQT